MKWLSTALQAAGLFVAFVLASWPIYDFVLRDFLHHPFGQRCAASAVCFREGTIPETYTFSSSKRGETVVLYRCPRHRLAASIRFQFLAPGSAVGFGLVATFLRCL
jgi:hypothetical protein